MDGIGEKLIEDALKIPKGLVAEVLNGAKLIIQKMHRYYILKIY